jgi:hypothetical protein
MPVEKFVEGGLDLRDTSAALSYNLGPVFVMKDREQDMLYRKVFMLTSFRVPYRGFQR